MEKDAKRTRLARIPAWVLSFMTLFALIVLLVFLEDPKSEGLSSIQIAGYIFCAILITAACFIICRTHPKSVWYTPVICNAVSIQGVVVYIFTGLSNLSELAYWGGIILLSTIAAIAGARKGRRGMNQVTY